MLPPLHWPPPYNIILFELDFNVKFPLLRLLHFLSDLKFLFIVLLDTGSYSALVRLCSRLKMYGLLLRENLHKKITTGKFYRQLLACNFTYYWDFFT